MYTSKNPFSKWMIMISKLVMAVRDGSYLNSAFSALHIIFNIAYIDVFVWKNLSKTIVQAEN